MAEEKKFTVVYENHWVEFRPDPTGIHPRKRFNPRFLRKGQNIMVFADRRFTPGRGVYEVQLRLVVDENDRVVRAASALPIQRELPADEWRPEVSVETIVFAQDDKGRIVTRDKQTGCIIFPSRKYLEYIKPGQPYSCKLFPVGTIIIAEPMGQQALVGWDVRRDLTIFHLTHVYNPSGNKMIHFENYLRLEEGYDKSAIAKRYRAIAKEVGPVASNKLAEKIQGIKETTLLDLKNASSNLEEELLKLSQGAKKVGRKNKLREEELKAQLAEEKKKERDLSRQMAMMELGLAIMRQRYDSLELARGQALASLDDEEHRRAGLLELAKYYRVTTKDAEGKEVEDVDLILRVLRGENTEVLPEDIQSDGVEEAATV